jgi:hypothetical protein
MTQNKQGTSNPPKKPRLLKPTEEQKLRIQEAFRKAQEYDNKYGVNFKLRVK